MGDVIKLNELAVQNRIARMAELKDKLNNWTPIGGDWSSVEAIKTEYEQGLKDGWGPLVGMPCTYGIGSDCYAAEVVWVSKSGHQIRIILTDTKIQARDGELFSRGKDGRYRKARTRVGYVTFLKAETRLDPSF